MFEFPPKAFRGQRVGPSTAEDLITSNPGIPLRGGLYYSSVDLVDLPRRRGSTRGPVDIYII